MAVRHKQVDHYIWQAEIVRATSSIIDLAKNPVGLTILCLKLEQGQGLPASSIAELKRAVVETLLSLESKRLLPGDDTGYWQIANVLCRVAWHMYVDSLSGAARSKIRNLTLSEVQRLIGEDSVTQQLFFDLCRSRFLNVVKENFFSEEIITFPEHLPCEFFVARQLTLIGSKSQQVLEQVGNRDDWQEIIMYFNELLLTQKGES